ncbi:ATP-binding protein [Anaerobranca gottschalkii]|uniref:histidine kinase n=1 Tax=Anaerobranca gottschalkii DSM 13577 TaxID=1120990 RepID=A0A1H9Y9D4_9FIRM|nr:ATP-binding protein [Anaerobranca gottschalkii]SES65466.1 Histidine kinase-, DNA gyrase B-, and HSP90-like ATPase [Anaerobranca gottschalkii DSM 13577]
MEDLSQIILDLAQNSLGANANKIEIYIAIEYANDLLTVMIKDDGHGMDEEIVKKCTDPFYTTRKTRSVGLGLSLTKMLCEQSGGSFEIRSIKGQGTTLNFSFKISHWDRPPVGKLEDTYLALIILNPYCEIIFSLNSDINPNTFMIDSKEIKENIGEDGNFSDPWVVSWLKEYLQENIYHHIKEELQ